MHMCYKYMYICSVCNIINLLPLSFDFSFFLFLLLSTVTDKRETLEDKREILEARERLILDNEDFCISK